MIPTESESAISKKDEVTKEQLLGKSSPEKKKKRTTKNKSYHEANCSFFQLGRGGGAEEGRALELSSAKVDVPSTQSLHEEVE